jgi:hypothetical protein
MIDDANLNPREQEVIRQAGLLARRAYQTFAILTEGTHAVMSAPRFFREEFLQWLAVTADCLYRDGNAMPAIGRLTVRAEAMAAIAAAYTKTGSYYAAVYVMSEAILCGHMARDTAAAWGYAPPELHLVVPGDLWGHLERGRAEALQRDRARMLLSPVAAASAARSKWYTNASPAPRVEDVWTADDGQWEREAIEHLRGLERRLALSGIAVIE